MNVVDHVRHGFVITFANYTELWTPGGYIALATSGGSPTVQSGGQNQKWPTSGPGGYTTCAVWVPNASEQGTKTEKAHKWAWWLYHRCRLGGVQRFRAGDEIRSGPRVGRVATKTRPPGGSATRDKIRSGPQVGAGLHNPYHLGDTQRFRAGDKIRSGPQVGWVAT